MYIDKHYPFEIVKMDYSLTGFDDFLDFATLSIHYNQIYSGFVEELNNLLKDEPSLQPLSLDEILFNEHLLNDAKKNKIITAGSGVYNHQIVFNSISPKNKTLISNSLNDAIIKKYQTLTCFYQELKDECMKMDYGFVFLVCDQNGDVFIKSILGNNTTVKENLCPILGIDMFEHAYFLKYKNNKKAYVEGCIKYINFDFVNHEYEECLKAIKKLKRS